VKIREYFIEDFKKSNLISLKSLFQNEDFFDDFTILESGSYSDGFFEYIVKKYSGDDTMVYKILNILFKNYNYPLKASKHELDSNFDNIIYFSLYNYKHIFINIKSYNSNDMLHPNINSIIPGKFKNLYIILLKTLYQMTCNDFESITYNVKFYSDYLYNYRLV